MLYPAALSAQKNSGGMTAIFVHFISDINSLSHEKNN